MKVHVDLLVTLQPREGRISELYESLSRLREASLAEPGCLYYRLARTQPPCEVLSVGALGRRTGIGNTSNSAAFH
jgi:quinol monooxygenase YgiN